MKTIAIYNLKGGIGKTTTSANLAYNLSQRGYKVLMIDMDQQGNLSTMFRRYNINQNTILHLLIDGIKPQRVIKRTRYKDLDIIPSDIRTVDVNPWTPDVLKDALTGLDYDYCIIDCPPAAGPCTVLAIHAADKVIVPVPATRWGKEGLNMVAELIEGYNEAAEIEILFTMFRKNKMSMENIKGIMWDYEYPVYDTVITRTEDIVAAENMRKPVALCRSKSMAAADYKEFTDEFLGRDKDAEIK